MKEVEIIKLREEAEGFLATVKFDFGMVDDILIPYGTDVNGVKKLLSKAYEDALSDFGKKDELRKILQGTIVLDDVIEDVIEQAEEQVEEAVEKVKSKLEDIKEKVEEKIMPIQEKLEPLTQPIAEKVVQPIIEKGKETVLGKGKEFVETIPIPDSIKKGLEELINEWKEKIPEADVKQVLMSFFNKENEVPDDTDEVEITEDSANGLDDFPWETE